MTKKTQKVGNNVSNINKKKSYEGPERYNSNTEGAGNLKPLRPSKGGSSNKKETK